MKYLFFALLLLVSCQNATNPESVIKELVPAELEIDQYPAAKQYLVDEIEMCGPGVVKDAKDKDGKPLPNNCSYQFAVDTQFIRNHAIHTGFRYDENWAYRPRVMFFQVTSREVPADFDIRDLMSGGLPPIKSQIAGDCWANASTSGLELARAVQDKKPVQHSTQTVISCSGEGTASGGGTMEAFDFVKNGLPLESDWGYLGKDVRCKWSKEELQKGWEPKMIGTPYIGSSLSYSRFKPQFAEGTKVRAIKEAMVAWKAPVVVTVDAYSISGSGVYSSCSAINSGGNHMVNVTGWDSSVNAHVWNSWGQQHGDKGVSRIKWECGDGKLNRGLGVAAKIAQYKSPCTPANVAFEKPEYNILAGSSLKLGRKQDASVKCRWAPEAGVENPNACETFVTPTKNTEYHLAAVDNCGTSSAMVLVKVWKEGRVSEKIVTPFGEASAK